MRAGERWRGAKFQMAAAAARSSWASYRGLPRGDQLIRRETHGLVGTFDPQAHFFVRSALRIVLFRKGAERADGHGDDHAGSVVLLPRRAQLKAFHRSVFSLRSPVAHKIRERVARRRLPRAVCGLEVVRHNLREEVVRRGLLRVESEGNKKKRSDRDNRCRAHSHVAGNLAWRRPGISIQYSQRKLLLQVTPPASRFRPRAAAATDKNRSKWASRAQMPCTAGRKCARLGRKGRLRRR